MVGAAETPQTAALVSTVEERPSSSIFHDVHPQQPAVPLFPPLLHHLHQRGALRGEGVLLQGLPHDRRLDHELLLHALQGKR